MEAIIIQAVYDDRRRKIGWHARLPEGRSMSWLFLDQAKRYLEQRYPECKYKIVE